MWAQKLKAKKDYRALAAINKSQEYGPAFQLARKRELANGILREAGAEAVDAIMEELDTDGVGSIDLANLLVEIGDTKAVPLLKKKLDRGDFSSYSSQIYIRRFVEKHPDLIGEVEMVRCALCGKTRPVTETRYVVVSYEEGRQVKRFCADTCWQKRGRVLKSGIGTDCPFYSEGMCTAGDGDYLCNLQAGSYKSSCHVYAMHKGTYGDTGTFKHIREGMNLIKVYVVLFHTPISSQEYSESMRQALGYGPGARIVGILPSDETLAKNSIRRACGDIWSMHPVPEVNIEKGDPQHFRNVPGIPGGGMNQYAIDFLKHKIAEGEDPDYFHGGYNVYVTTSTITGGGTLTISIYKS